MGFQLAKFKETSQHPDKQKEGSLGSLFKAC